MKCYIGYDLVENMMDEIGIIEGISDVDEVLISFEYLSLCFAVMIKCHHAHTFEQPPE